MNWYSPPAIILLVCTLLIVGGVIYWISIDTKEPVEVFSVPAGQKRLSFEERLAAVLLKNTTEKTAFLEALGREWATASSEKAFACHQKFKGTVNDRHAFDHGAMDILARRMPESILKEVQKDVWWPDQWKHEQAALTLLLNSNKTDVIKAHIVATFDLKRQRHLGKWLGRQRAKPVVFVETIWERAGKKESPMLTEILESWFNKTPAAGARWLNRQTGAIREAALPVLVKELAETGPAEALEWAVTAATEEARNAQVRSVVEKAPLPPQMQRGFSACLKKSGLPEIEQQSLLAITSGPQPPR